ncbi:MAG: thiamine pyrophosphate-dependent enzyme [Chloroflexota bacterium]
MAQLTGGEAIVKSLIHHGMDTLFCLPGVQNDHFFNALYDEGGDTRIIHTRHEQGAAYMALGYALSQENKPGIYSVVPGAGFLNTATALSTAYGANAKVFCMTGQIPSTFIGRGFGQLHEIPDQLGVMRSLTKWAERIRSPAEAPRLIREAFRQMYSGRPRPVALECAMDTLAERTEVTLLRDETAVSDLTDNPPVNLDRAEEAAKRLGNAKNPLIFVGGGAMHASEEVKQLAEMLEAPVVTYSMGRGVLSSDHYLSQFIHAGYPLWQKADAILAVGTRLSPALLRWGVEPGDKLIKIDVDPEDHTRHPKTAVRLVADAKDALQAIIELAGKHNGKRESREAELRDLKAQSNKLTDRLGPQKAYLNAIRAELPPEGLFVDEVTQMGFASRLIMPVYNPYTYISPGYQGTLGWGFATALGVKVAHPDKPVVSVSGDGGFMFTVQELATAVQQKIGLVTLVFNDGAFGNVRRMQKQNYNNRLIASDLQNPDFVKLAESFGAQGLRANSPEELREALKRGFATSDVPTVVDVPFGEVPSPWPFIMAPKTLWN